MEMRIKNEKYKMKYFLLRLIQAVPMQLLFHFIYTGIDALLPACQTLAVARFINTAERIIRGEEEGGGMIASLAVLLFSIAFSNLMPSAASLVSVSRDNKLKTLLKEIFLRKQAALQYHYMENKEACELIHRVCDRPEQRFGEGIQNFFQGLGLFIKIISLMVIVMQASWISGTVILAVSIPLFFLAKRTGKKNYLLEKDALDIKRKYTYLADILSNRECARERALFGYSGEMIKRYERLFQSANKKEVQIEKKRYANMKSGSFITVGIALVIMMILLPAVRSARMTAGLYVGLAGAILGLVQSMSWTLSAVVQKHVKLKEYLKELQVFFNMEEKAEADVEPKEIEDFCLSTIEFRNVSFKYPNEKHYVLRNCSFVLEGDRRYSFVGKNGAGKTTITRLLVGMYDDFEGDILINGKRIQEYSFAGIKWMFSVVFQDFARYALSVKDNIILGRANHPDMQLLERVSRESGIEEWIQKLPDGIETMLGKIDKGSVDLSGGQWQKLAIARLLYGEAPINILDEPTASLDPKAEAAVYETFGRVNRGRFTIFITHRLGAARMSDEILVLDQGKIAEKGTHDQLMGYKKGIYREMFESQRCWYEA